MAKGERLSSAALFCPYSLLAAAFYSDVHQRSTNLPKDIIVAEILPRLPIKALFKFKCVSKGYKRIISHSNFGRNYMRRAYNSSPVLSGLLASSEMMMVFPFMDLPPFRHIFDIDVKDLTETINSSWSRDKEDEFGVSVNSVPWLPYCNAQKLLASSNGLMLSRFKSFPNGCKNDVPPRFGLCVSNPLTKHCVKITDPKPLLDPSSIYTLATRREEEALLTYKVVGISIYGRVSVAIFSSDTGCWATWKPFCPGYCGLPKLKQVGGFAYKGILHWLDDRDGTVFTYDPYNSPDQFDRFPLPNGRCLNSSLIYSGNSGEEQILKYCEITRGTGFDRFSVWLLVDDSDSAKRTRWDFEGEFQVQSLGDRGREIFQVAPNPWNRELICHPYVDWSTFRVMNLRSGTSKIVSLFKEDSVPTYFCSGKWECPLLAVEFCPWSSPFYAQPN